jgi:ABC-type tungstate transport system permease subunit
MTDKIHARVLHYRAADKLDIMLKAHKALIFHYGFMDINIVANYRKAYTQWQKAEKRFSDFILFVQENGGNWDREYD